MPGITRVALLVLAALLPQPLLAQGPSAPSDASLVFAQAAQVAQVAQASGESLLDRPARLRIEGMSLTDALSELQARSATPIVFSPSLLPSDHRVTCDCRDRSVREALDRLLIGLTVDYAQVGDYVVIERRAEMASAATASVRVASTGSLPGLARNSSPDARPLREIRGTVVDRGTGLTLRGATVTLDTETTGRTSADGEFRFLERLDDGAVLRVVRPGYHAESIQIGPAGGEVRVALRAKLLSQEEGTLIGSVVARDTGEPLDGVEIIVEGTSYATTTREDGRFMLTGVPRGTHTILARRLGYATARSENVRVPSGATVEVNFSLRTQALTLEEVVVTGVTDPTSGAKVPFSVGRLTVEDMPVPAINTPIASLQGKIPGVDVRQASGEPGSGVWVQLRSPTSMIRSNEPMYVVDGVILGSGVDETTVDISSLDIESIEVIKGAAAAALYGSRAAAGVISIITSRGAAIPQGSTRVSARTEMGYSAVPKGIPLSNSHFYALDDAGNFIDADGAPTTDPDVRVIDPDRIMDNPYPGQLFNNLDRFYDPGLTMTNSVSLSQNTAATNFLLSVNNHQEKGTIVTNDGYQRTNFRINLDHRINDDLMLSASAYHNRSQQDNLSGSPFWDLLMFPPDIDLGIRDESGNFVQQPDPQVLRENPIWRQTSRDNHTARVRTLLSSNARFRPISWLSFDGNVSYDRADNTRTIYVPKGTPFVTTSDEDESLGRLDKREIFNDNINASAGANILWNFGDLTTRTSLRALMERETYTRVQADARDFWVEGVENLGVAQRMITDGYEREIRSNGFSGSLGLDYDGKYIGDLLLRRDGSSLFGPDARWANYYRVSAAYRMAREPWWPIAQIGEFKLRFSQGTSGGRPEFSDRFETWSVSSSGTVSKSTLGNRELRPEHTTEREFGMDMIFLDRFQLELTYATQETTDQIIQIPQPAVTGYSNRYENSGTVEGHTYEATLQANLITRPDLQWSTSLVADRTRSEFTEWNRVCYIPSVGYTYRCLGWNHTQFYGERFIDSPADLHPRHAGSADQFAVNDDGYLVAVGSGSLSDPQWGDFVTIDGVDYKWGHPIIETDEDGNPLLQRIGEGFPDFTMGWQNQVHWKDLSLFTHMHAQVGGQVYNRTKQRLYQHYRHQDLEQTGKPEDQKKTLDYYQTLYEANNVNSHFVEPGGFLKLREVSLRYSIQNELLSRLRLDRFGTDRITLGLVGRNLLTFTDYSGFDPEVTLSNDRSEGFLRVDSFSWPHTRTFTGLIEIQF